MQNLFRHQRLSVPVGDFHRNPFAYQASVTCFQPEACELTTGIGSRRYGASLDMRMLL